MPLMFTITTPTGASEHQAETYFAHVRNSLQRGLRPTGYITAYRPEADTPYHAVCVVYGAASGGLVIHTLPDLVRTNAALRQANRPPLYYPISVSPSFEAARAAMLNEKRAAADLPPAQLESMMDRRAIYEADRRLRKEELAMYKEPER